jgi:uncharacterized NAD(P)/FAD-binding protein YdhS
MAILDSGGTFGPAIPAAGNADAAIAGDRTPPDPEPFTVVIVGAGPAGTSLLERVCMNVPSILPDRPVRVHLVDPYPPGGGRIWRAEQSSLMWTNTPMATITVFPDASMAVEGAGDPGSSMTDWVRDTDPSKLGPELAEELRHAHPGFYPSRPALAAYLSSVIGRLMATAPPNVEVVVHTDSAVELIDSDTHTTVRFAVGLPIRADAVLLAQGHHDVEPAPAYQELDTFGRQHGLSYLPARYAADVDLSELKPGQPVIVRGLALSFIDYMVLLTQARGGEYVRDADGVLQYRPSGREPVLYAGSRRGVPYRVKFGYTTLQTERHVPRFLTSETAKELIARPDPVGFGADVQPLITAEMEYAHYHELFAGYPDRVATTWDEVADAFELTASTDPAERAELAELITRTVPDPADRFDLHALEYPLEGLHVADADTLHHLVHDHVAADLARRRDPAHSPDLATLHALMTSIGPIFQLLASYRLSAYARTQELDPWFHDFFGYIGSGPPGPRAEELLALSRAGIVRFIGGGLEVIPDPERGVFRATGTNAPVTVEAEALLEARLPKASVIRNRDPLIHRLHTRGACTEELLRDHPDGPAFGSGKLAVAATDQRVLAADGTPHPRLFAVGAWTAGFGPAGFPRLNPVGFLRCDAMVRAMLKQGAEKASVAESESVAESVSS